MYYMYYYTCTISLSLAVYSRELVSFYYCICLLGLVSPCRVLALDLITWLGGPDSSCKLLCHYDWRLGEWKQSCCIKIITETLKEANSMKKSDLDEVNVLYSLRKHSVYFFAYLIPDTSAFSGLAESSQLTP